ncbi:MAG TPA: hypothetical protein VIH42_09525, partial [Thermoguttaceae bacterium]
GGLISKNKSEFHRKVPWLGDVPVLGRLFRYDGTTNEKRELLIIMTPHIIRNETDAEAIKQAETARMNWCLSDVTELWGDLGLKKRNSEWSDQETNVIYPDLDPRATKQSEKEGKMPTPEKIPLPPEPPQLPSGAGGANHQPQDRPAKSAAFINTDVQIPYQAYIPAQGVQPTSYQRPAGQAARTDEAIQYQSDSNTANPVVPTMYDAPPRYPTTQTPYYR